MALLLCGYCTKMYPELVGSSPRRLLQRNAAVLRWGSVKSLILVKNYIAPLYGLFLGPQVFISGQVGTDLCNQQT